MERNKNILARLDWYVIIVYLCLVFIGWINIYSAVYSDSHNSIFDISQKYGKQIIWIATSIFLAIIIIIIDSKFYSSFAYLLYLIGIISLIAVLFFGVEINSAKAWFQIGNFRIQPVEFVKIAVALALSQLLSSRGF